MKYTIAILFSLLFMNSFQAQTDTAFWFAAPFVSSNNLSAPNQDFEKPIYLRISTSSQAAVVKITQPANPSFTPIVVNIASGTTSTIDLTPFLSSVETTPADLVLNTGLLITSSAPVTIYYEVASLYCNCNPEIFALKGSNALGTSFYTPFQNQYDNNNTYNPKPYSSFDIVASEDNTTVTITPSRDIVGHAANVPFTITLNRGQTYSAQAAGYLASEHPAGSYVVSNKPIAITVKDDLVHADKGPLLHDCDDLMGDQCVPVNLVGDEYIVTQGFMNPGEEQLYVLATQDNTSISVNGTPVSTINKGQTYTHVVATSTVYVKTSAPVYVTHATGFGCELGQAILPPINCTGSYEVGFTRSAASNFGLIIVTRAGNQGNFKLNNNGALIPAGAFVPVNGTNGAWMAAQILFSTTDIPVNAASLVTNSSGAFHLGIINGDPNGGSRYGYFSNYSGLKINMTTRSVKCYNGIDGGVMAIPSGGGKFYTYTWAPDIGNSNTAGDLAAGTYSVTVNTDNGCSATASVTVTQPTPVSVSSVATDNVICFGAATGTASVSMAGGTPTYTYSWLPSGGTESTASNLVAGNYSVTVKDANGCSFQQTITMTQPASGFSFAGSVLNDVKCKGDATGSVAVVMSGNSPPYFYSWSSSVEETGSSVSGLQAGNYTVTITDSKGCTKVQPFVVKEPSLKLSITDSAKANVLCYGGVGTASVIASGGVMGSSYSYSWSPSGGTTNSASNLPVGNYIVTVTDSNGCKAQKTFAIGGPSLPLAATAQQNNVLCHGGKGTASVTVTGGTKATDYKYQWTPSVGTGAVVSNLSEGGYTVTVTDDNGCTLQQSFAITQPMNPLSIASVENHVLCFGGKGSISVAVSGGTKATDYNYVWNPSVGSVANVSGLPAGSYSVMVTDDNGCTIQKEFSITQPSASLAITSGKTDVSCNGDATGAASIDVTGGTKNYEYIWVPTGGTAVMASGLSAKEYTVTVKDANNCTLTHLITITEPPLLKVSLPTIPPTCYGQTATITPSVSDGTPAYRYSWFPVMQTSSSISVSPQVSTTYSLTVTDNNGCTAGASANLQLLPLPQPDFVITKSLIQEDGEVCLSNTTVASPGGHSWFWDFGDTYQTMIEHPCHAYEDTGSYCVSLTAVNSYGCQDSVMKCMKVEQKFVLIIPNVFTPNGDGKNDVFKIYTEGVSQLHCAIYDRWGLLIYEWDGITGGWNGITGNGLTASDATYYFIVDGTKAAEKERFEEKGFLQLIH